MPTGETTEGNVHKCHYLTTYWGDQGAAPQRLPISVGGKDTDALLDSGSTITLVRQEFTTCGGGDKVTVSCVHGDSQKYPTAFLMLHSPCGIYQVRARVVKWLPVPVLMG